MKPKSKSRVPKLKVQKSPETIAADFYFVHYLEANVPPAVGYAAHTAIAVDEADAKVMMQHLIDDGRRNVVIVPGSYAK